MASGNGNGDSLNPIASPSAVEEVSNVLVPQIPAQTTPPLFDDRCIFISAPQYHWHVTEGDTGLRQHIIALAQQLHEFGQRTEAREAEMWRRLGLVATTNVMQATLARHYAEAKSGLDQMRNQLALLQGRDLDKMVTDLALLRVDQDHMRGELVPGLQQNEAGLRTRIEQLEQDLINLRAQQMHKQQQAAAEVDKKLLDMELKICKTFNDTMEQHVEVVKAIKEEMVAVRQLQEK